MLPYFDPDYENFNQHINPPRVSIDNTTCKECTLVKVDSMNKPGILLEVVQVLSDMNLTILKAYITSDGGWFMDVFHVVDQHGQQVTDQKTINYLDKALGPGSNLIGSSQGQSAGMHSIGDHTAIEMTGTDRPGLLSEVFAVLADLQCNIIAAEVWTHRTRVACVLYVNDSSTGRAVEGQDRRTRIQEQLKNVLRGYGDDARGARTDFAVATTHADRRLHQLMLADVDYDSCEEETNGHAAAMIKPDVTIGLCREKDYSTVNVRCKDRPKLLFDIVCTLTDMQYVVSHASISSDGVYGLQELYIRRKDALTLNKDEAERVIKCLEAAISRRVSEGCSTLELCGRDRVGLLSDVTRVIREHGLTVMRADVTTVDEQATNVFYVRYSSGEPVGMNTVEALRREIGHTVMLNMKREPNSVAAAGNTKQSSGLAKTSNLFTFGSLFGLLRG